MNKNDNTSNIDTINTKIDCDAVDLIDKDIDNDNNKDDDDDCLRCAKCAIDVAVKIAQVKLPSLLCPTDRYNADIDKILDTLSITINNVQYDLSNPCVADLWHNLCIQ